MVGKAEVRFLNALCVFHVGCTVCGDDSAMLLVIAVCCMNSRMWIAFVRNIGHFETYAAFEREFEEALKRILQGQRW